MAIGKAAQSRSDFRKGMIRAAWIARSVKNNYPQEVFTGSVHDSRVVDVIHFVCELVAEEIEKRCRPTYPGPEETPTPKDAA